MITPTIGRVVLYWPAPTDELAGIRAMSDQPVPALICHVWTDTCINIGGFDANGKPFSRTSIWLRQGDENGPRPKGGFAEWTPYQKGQAAKTEALEKQLAAVEVPSIVTLSERPPYQQRVIAECRDLDEKIQKLSVFLGSVEFAAVHNAEQKRLLRQQMAMLAYVGVLDERIQAFDR